MAETAKSRSTYAEYLAGEEASSQRHEFHDGTVVAMAGGTPEHSLLVARALVTLGNALAGGPCALFESNLRVYLAASRRALYPDASVVCGKLTRAEEDRDAATNPRVILEVLSPSTEAYDRGEKFELYQSLPSFQEYVLIASQRVRIEVVRRDVGGTWRHEYFGPGGHVQLASVNVMIEVDEVYSGWAELAGT